MTYAFNIFICISNPDGTAVAPSGASLYDFALTGIDGKALAFDMS
jgi:hypothetical protein